MNRQTYNKQILTIISDMIDKCPDMRFIQILHALKIIDMHDIKGEGHIVTVPKDRFYEEPNETLNRIADNAFLEYLYGDKFNFIK